MSDVIDLVVTFYRHINLYILWLLGFKVKTSHHLFVQY